MTPILLLNQIYPMRPFQFFFMVAVGVILFFALAKVFIAALFIAMIMSVLFFIGQKISHFFRYITWNADDYEFERAQRQANRRHFSRRPMGVDPMFDTFYNKPVERIIVVQ